MTFTILSLLILFSAVAAQTQPPPTPPLYTFHPSIPTIVVMVLAMIFFIGFFSLYLRLCSGSSANQLLAAAASLRSRSPGLDAATVASFPVFHYYEVKELKIGKNALECAICLNEFEDDETLRLLPDCDHVFHPECIDAWLQSHVTCPVCRANLLPFSSTENPLPNQLPPAQPALESISIRGIVIDPVESESDFVPPREGSISRRIGFLGKSVHVPQAQTCEQRIYGKFPRSHSTGHSLVRSGENTDRFTLRFPEHVRKEVMTRALIRTATFNQTTEGSSRRSRRGGEGSSRGARSYKRLDREVKSDRWMITMPFSFGEGSVGRGKTAVKLPSFKCLEPGTSGDSVGQTRPAEDVSVYPASIETIMC